MTNKTDFNFNKQMVSKGCARKASLRSSARFTRLHPSRKRPDRRAFTIIETGVGIFILSVCMIMLAQLRTVLITQQLRMDTADTARLQIQNIFELLGDLSDEKIAAQNFDKDKFIKLAANTLPRGEITFEVTPLIFKANPQNDPVQKPAPEAVPKKSGLSDQKKSSESVEAAVFRITVSWSDGEKRPRRSLSLVRILSCAPAKK